jgi:hypothetical protein
MDMLLALSVCAAADLARVARGSQARQSCVPTLRCSCRTSVNKAVTLVSTVLQCYTTVCHVA